MAILEIHDAADSRLVPYLAMRDAELIQRASPDNEHGADATGLGGLFVAEGELVLARLVGSRYPVHSLLVARSRVEGLQPMLDRLGPTVPVFVAPQDVLNRVVGFNMHRGVLGLGVRTSPWTVADLVRSAGPLVVLEDLVNHDNLGAAFRNLAALGGTGAGVILSPKCADPLYRKSLRVSMGSILTIPYARAQSWPGVLSELAQGGWATWALTPAPDAVPIGVVCARLGASPRVALVAGSEGPGLTPAAQSACSARVVIRMRKSHASIDSLNVAMAIGIALDRVGESMDAASAGRTGAR